MEQGGWHTNVLHVTYIILENLVSFDFFMISVTLVISRPTLLRAAQETPLINLISNILSLVTEFHLGASDYNGVSPSSFGSFSLFL